MSIKNSKYFADIDEIGNVNAPSPTHGSALTWDSLNSYWKPQAIIYPLYDLQSVSSNGDTTTIQCDFQGDILTDAIDESTTNAGVTIDGIRSKDNVFSVTTGNLSIGSEASLGTINFRTSALDVWQMDGTGRFVPVFDNLFSLGNFTNRIVEIWCAQVASFATDMTFGTASAHHFNWYTAAAIRWRVLGASLSGGAVGDLLPETDNAYYIGNSTKAPAGITTHDLTVQGDTSGVNDVIDVYDNTGGLTFTTTAITVNLDTTRKNTAGSNFSLASDIITIAVTGIYLVTYSCTTDGSTGAGRSTSTAYIELDPATATFTEIDGTRCYMYNRDTTNGNNTGTRTFVLDVTVANSRIRMQVVRDSGSDTLQTKADGSSITIMR
ncbi:MAG: hypothetical protein KDH96_08460, partial [Candidatus Riesia sp.]|nr:hypothetical protein [Candidatus Riesia sp.]